MAHQFLQLKISSPSKVIFEGPVTAISSKNSTGKFDILPEHANFITLVENQPIIVKTGDKSLEFDSSVALIYTRDDQVMIYTDFIKSAQSK